ncbi:MAG: class I SAM-dependent methyltransferase [Candidatus Heimdallarchaeaceae archaeon]
MVSEHEQEDRHLSLLAHKISRLLEPSKRMLNPYIKRGMIVADLGSGPGYYSLHIAKRVGSEGKVFAIDSDEKSIRVLKEKSEKLGYSNIEAKATSASELSFIEDETIDFVFSYGLLCCMAPKEHESTLKEIKRILKPSGLAMLSISKDPSSYVSKQEWERMLEQFKVEKKKNRLIFRQAEVRKK